MIYLQTCSQGVILSKRERNQVGKELSWTFGLQTRKACNKWVSAKSFLDFIPLDFTFLYFEEVPVHLIYMRVLAKYFFVIPFKSRECWVIYGSNSLLHTHFFHMHQ